jgi:signal transduction histidine kinase
VTFLGEVIPEEHPCRVDLDAIAQSTEALHRLVNDVIAFSAIRRGQLEIRPQLLEVRPLVRRIVQSHRQFSSVPLLCVVEGPVPRHMVCDPMRLQQILTNGLTNAW